jgi:hypothetical protein
MVEGLVELAGPSRCLGEGSEEFGSQPGESEYVTLAWVWAVEVAFPQPEPGQASALPVSVEVFKIEKLQPAADSALAACWLLSREL